jgi:hypothetical protein
MPVTIRRSTARTGLVLLSSSVEVAADGLVTIPARFLAPDAGLSSSDFLLDSAWPSTIPLPLGMPGIQGGPFLVSRSISTSTGLTFIDALYVSALNPVRLVEEFATEKKNFNGFFFQSSTIGGTQQQSLSFDYFTTAVTHSYALIEPNLFDSKPSGIIGDKFNIVSSGQSGLVEVQIREEETVERAKTRVGKVSRIQTTVRRILVQDGSIAIPTTPWSGNSFGSPFTQFAGPGIT